MKTIFWILLLTLVGITGFSQSEEKAREVLAQINSLDQLDSLVKALPEWDISVRHTPPIGFFSDSVIVRSEIGEMCKTSDINNSGVFLHKIISRKKEELCKVRIIFFNGLNRTLEEVDSIRNIVLDKYANGIDFSELHDTYNEDGNKSGILDWFCKGIMVQEFENAVWLRKKNEVFKVDVPSLQWHFIVLKTEKNKMTKVTQSICIKIK